MAIRKGTGRAHLRRRGAVLVCFSALPEMVQLADHCLVIYGGRIFQDFAEQAVVAANLGLGPALRGLRHGHGAQRHAPAMAGAAGPADQECRADL